MNSLMCGFEDTIDLSQEETLRILSSPNLRYKIKHGRFFLEYEIFYKEKWYHLCRTDLKDDVCTTKRGDLEYYKRICQFGARIRGDSFAVIDSFSDG